MHIHTLTRFRRWLLAPATGAAVLATLAGLTLGSAHLPPTPASDDAVATPAPVVASLYAWPSPAYTVERRYVGRVEAARSSALGFELGGRIAAVHVDEGQTIAAGQEIAALDRERLLARRREAEAALAEARAHRDLARLTDARVRRMVAGDAASAQRGDDTRKGVEAAAARVARAEARLAAIEVDLAKSVLYAPYAGTIADRHHDEGTVVAAGEPIVSLLETGRLEVRVGVAARAVAALASDAALRVEVAGTPRRARLLGVDAERDRGTRTVDVLLALTDAGADARATVRPGDLAELVVEETVEAPGFWLPTAALAEGTRGLWSCFVAVPLPARATTPGGATHRLERRQLQVVHAGSDDVYATGLLAPGDLVVGAGVHRLTPGQPVRLASALAADAAAATSSASNAGTAQEDRS